MIDDEVFRFGHDNFIYILFMRHPMTLTMINHKVIYANENTNLDLEPSLKPTLATNILSVDDLTTDDSSYHSISLNLFKKINGIDKQIQFLTDRDAFLDVEIYWSVKFCYNFNSLQWNHVLVCSAAIT
ncbi:CLUMA_CG008080, isoform A [Clunio marinus]|uniref:CLUMA_CG008080, isoform A n=1 Tax=Clunio marinus TaxID=568069 RepID=A0A1J1I4Q7_9DIPT|nr:CLUMA_CG008080, isoform A [Clunio marinus]